MAIYIGNQKVSVKGGLPVEVVEEVGEQVDFTLANATESDVLSGKTFYAQDSTLKTGTLEMASEISIPIFTGDCSYQFYYDRWTWFIEEYGDKIVTQDVTKCENMFAYSSKLTHIPFEINCKSDTNIDLSSMFAYSAITSVPKINNCKLNTMRKMFYYCNYIRYMPEDFESWFDWSRVESGLGDSESFTNAFNGCYSLRRFPSHIFNHAYPKTAYNYAFYSSMANGCHCLDEIIGLPVPYTSEWKYNAFLFSFQSCSRVKNITFALQENGQPYVVSWKSQTIDLATDKTGCSNNTSYILNYNSGITNETRITNDATYQLYKNHPDSWTADMAYSRYNHDSAVATINSLPDTSAYLSANGGTNTIKFRGNSGSKTDGGAINTLTEEEIAVATAKGWTVTFS